MARLVIEYNAHREFVDGVCGIKIYYDLEAREDRLQVCRDFYVADMRADCLRYGTVKVELEHSEYCVLRQIREKDAEDGERTEEQLVRLVIPCSFSIEQDQEGWVSIKPVNRNPVVTMFPTGVLEIEIVDQRR